MADPHKAVKANVEGNFFVDSTCINCDTCRQLAPSVFKDSGEFSCVSHQPETANEDRAATRALLCCPTGSIGTNEKNSAKEVMSDLPLPIADGVFYCGFNSPKSYGGNSYFVQAEGGNWLIDSPKFLPHLKKQFAARGGVKYIFLTHRDDVADAALYAQEFSAQRIIHARDRDAQPDCEIIIEGEVAREFAAQFTIIPTPGHTRGHMVLLYRNRFLFTGDHLAYDRENNELEAFHDFCWYSWDKQIISMEKLLDYQFEYVLAGHGDRTQMPIAEMHQEMVKLVARMKKAA